ncbi:hypothetical protein HispidOSU_022209, partial [Sigmodon hispidus]
IFYLLENESEQKTRRRDGNSVEKLNGLFFMEMCKKVYDKISILPPLSEFCVIPP